MTLGVAPRETTINLDIEKITEIQKFRETLLGWIGFKFFPLELSST